MPIEMSDSDSRMSPLDALLHRGDAEPATRSTLLAVCVLDRAPDSKRLTNALERTSRRVIRLRQRVIETAVPVLLPEWALDPDFDLDRHLRFWTLPAPGSMADLLDVVQREVVHPLAHDRPLWEATVVTGLQDARAALLLKLSHAISDGVGLLRLFSALFDQRRDQHHGRLPSVPVVAEHPPEDDFVSATLSRLPSLAASALRHGPATVRSALTRSDDVARAVLEYLSSVRRIVTATAAPSPALRARSLARRCIAFDVPLAELKLTAKSSGASVNDVYVAGLAGALRRYHLALGVPAAPLPLAIPVNLRDDGDVAAGNRFGVVTLSAPLDVADPHQRVKRVQQQVDTGLTEAALDVPLKIASIAARLPGWARRRAAAITPRPDVQASNLPGPAKPVYIAGCRILNLYAYGPVPGVAGMFAMTSLAGTCHIAGNLDAAAFVDVERFAECLYDEFAELLPGPSGKRHVTRPAAGRAH